jgi:hypothetical protein
MREPSRAMNIELNRPGMKILYVFWGAVVLGAWIGAERYTRRFQSESKAAKTAAVQN